jgi:anti-sigma factor (TIGR02949 family)
MDCPEAREHLADLNRGQLGADVTGAVRAHVAQCAACRAALEADAEIRSLIRARAPRHTAPPALRARIEALVARPRRAGWAGWWAWLRLHPWPAGALAGAVCVLLVVWAWWVRLPEDPVARMTAQAVAEHVEYVKEMMSRPAADPGPLFRELRSQVDFPFEPVFQGDPQVQLVAGVVGELSGRRAATFIYRDAAGRYTTLFLMPGAGVVVPEGDRMLIETFRPHYRAASGRSLILWKHRDLAWLLVSDLDKNEVPAMYLKVRKAANPPSAFLPAGIS